MLKRNKNADSNHDDDDDVGRNPPSEFWVPFIINMLHEAERKVDLCAEDGVL